MIKRVKFNAQEVDVDVFHEIYVCTLEYKSYSKSCILRDRKSDFVFNNDFQEVWFLSSLSVYQEDYISNFLKLSYRSM